MTPGTRVRLLHSTAFWRAGLEGTVVPMRASRLNGHDFAVELDGDDRPTCWNADEVEVIEP